MFRIDLPISESFILLTPGLSGMSRFTQVGVLMGIFLLLVGLILFLYSYEIRLIARRYAVALLGLRVLLIAVILFVVGMRPRLAHTTITTIPSKFLIAIDRSDSMQITDPQRSGLEKIQLARGLRLARDITDDARLETWIRILEAGGTLNPSERPLYDRVAARVDELTRKEVAMRVLGPEGTALLKGLRAKHEVDVIGFTQNLSELPADAESLRNVLASDGNNPGQAFTDLKLPLKRFLERGSGGEGKILGMIILTDGRHNWGEDPLKRLLDIKQGETPVPMYPVVCGPQVPPADIAIISAKAVPSTVFKHAYTTIEIRVLINNQPPGRIRVKVDYPEAKELPDRKPIIEIFEHDGSQRAIRTITLQAKMDRPATETLKVTVEGETADGKKADDRFAQNNEAQVVVSVVPDKAKVLIIDGEARWELHYLHTALIRDETMETRSVVFDQPRLNLIKDAELKQLQLPETSLPEEDILLGCDCIILGDVSAEQLPRAEREKLEKYVAERGGTLVILAGKRSMPLEFAQREDPLVKLLPIQDPRVIEPRQGFRVELTGEGKETGFLRLEPAKGLSLERWASLPQHYWAVTGKVKDGAIPLAFVNTDHRGIVAPGGSSPERERNQALIARQNYGFGRVVFVGLDSTWRWRYRKGDVYHHRFWSQVIRWAASDRALTTGNEFVRFGVRQPVYRADEDVEMLVRFSEKAPKLAAGALAGARFFRKIRPDGPDEPVALAPLKPHPVVPRELDGVQANLPPGDYQLELDIPDMENKLNGPDGTKLRAPFKVLPPDTGELLDLSTDQELLEKLASNSVGQVFQAADAEKLLEKLEAQAAHREETTESFFWRSWWFLIPLLGLLTLEWATRKWAGLP